MVRTRTITMLSVATAGPALGQTGGQGVNLDGGGWTVVTPAGAPDLHPAGATAPNTGPVYR
jgi:hypothetical protein